MGRDALPFDELDDAAEAALDAWRSGEFDDFDVTVPPLDDDEPESDIPSDLDDFSSGQSAAATLPVEDRPLDPRLAEWVAAKPPERSSPIASPESIDGAAAAIAHARAVVEPESLFTPPVDFDERPPPSATPEAPRQHGESSPLSLPPGDGSPEAPTPVASVPVAAPDPPAPPARDGRGGPAEQPPPGAALRAPPRQITGLSCSPSAPGPAEPDTGTPPARPPAGPGAPAPHRDDTLATAMAPQLGLELGVAHDRQPAVRLTDLFVVPPFSTLDSRADYWRKRKTGWLSLGIQSEVGRSASPYHGNGEGGTGVPSPASVLGRRDGLTLQSDTVRDPTFYAKKRAAERRAGRELSLDEFRRDHYVAPETPAASISNTGTSVFDPVLCEVAYRWFSPPTGTVLDPFAGGSVRGVVASVLGRRYVGVELRPEQVHANRVNAGEIVGPDAAWDFAGRTPMPVWVEGSATDLRALVPRARRGTVPAGGLAESVPHAGADLVFTCPPYADLEVYSDDPRDLSTAPYAVFRAMLASAIAQSAELLADDRFAIWVVGEARDPRTGYSYGIVADTVAAARAAGLGLYNEAILYTAIASAAMRATNQHVNSRKLVRVHQHVLVFVKGDPKRAATACGDPQLGGAS